MGSLIPFLFSVLVAVGLFVLRESALRSEPALGNVLIAGMVLSVIFGLLVSAVVWTYFMIRYMFVYFAAAEGAGILEAYGRGTEITRGAWLQLFLALVVIALFTMAGVLLFIIGQYLTSLVAQMVYSAIYLDLKAQTGQSEQ